MTEIISKKNNKLLPISAAAFVFAVIMIVVSIISIGRRNTGVGKQITLANRFLSEMSYEQAIAGYEEALKIDPLNKEALLGLMQAAYETENVELLEDTFQIFSNAYGERYSGEMDEMSSQVDSLKKEMIATKVTLLIEEGKFEEAELVLEEYGTESDDFDQALIEVIEKCAEEAWNERDFDKAMAYLEKAYELAENKDRVANELANVIEVYITDCINNQEYETAKIILERLKSFRDKNVCDSYEEKITFMEQVDEELQGKIDNLDEALANDDISLLRDILQDDSFKSNGRLINTVFFCNSLKQGGNIQGKGTAIYCVGNQLYVYYGEFENGLRNGQGVYYYSDYENRLCKLILTWENDLPNGESRWEKYSSIYDSDRNISEKTEEVDIFTAKYGIIEGTCKIHSDVKSAYPYSYDAEATYIDGYGVPIEAGDYPRELSNMIGNTPLLYWAKVGDAWIWCRWSSSRTLIPGIYVASPECKTPTEPLRFVTEI